VSHKRKVESFAQGLDAFLVAQLPQGLDFGASHVSLYCFAGAK
jgi:hypothetical protein